MKEILKYLRNIHSFSQGQVAQKIGLSRQSYYKYETGIVIPSDAVVGRLADLYGVEKDFIYKNEIPLLPGQKERADVRTDLKTDGGHKSVTYKIDKDFGRLAVADSGVYGAAKSLTATAVATENGAENAAAEKSADRTAAKEMSGSAGVEQGDKRTYSAYFDGATIRVLDGAEQFFKKGQRFVLVEDDEEGELERRRRALRTLKKYRGTLNLPENFDYKEELYKALMEKYDSIN